MSAEIERRFLVDAIPPDVELARPARVRQGYIALDGEVSVRVREIDDLHVLTVKAGRGLSRVEIEREIAADEFEALWPTSGGRRIEKLRHRLRLGDHVAEVDVFGGALRGLVIAEVEFDSVDGADGFEPPPWFAREVTGDRAWNNDALAVDGPPEPIG